MSLMPTTICPKCRFVYHHGGPCRVCDPRINKHALRIFAEGFLQSENDSREEDIHLIILWRAFLQEEALLGEMERRLFEEKSSD